MSEKRFYLDEEDRLCIHYDGRILASVGFQETEAQKIVDVLNEQQATINRLEEENEQLKQQLLYDGDDVCDICKHEYLTPSGDYFIGKCKKGHEECSKKDIKYCEDFELEWDD